MDLQSRFNNRYTLQKELSISGLAKVYQVQDEKSHHLYALKLFPSSSPGFNTELDVYSSLQSSSQFCSIHSSGQSDSGNFLIMTLLKESAEKFIKNSDNYLSTILNLAHQLILRLEILHNSSFVHRKICPSNLMIDSSKNNPNLILIDFSTSKRFRDPVSKLHHKYSEGREFSSCIRFSSVNVHRGIDYSRRDDIESWAYLSIFWLNQKLPWDLEANHDLPKKVLLIKSKIVPEKLCEGLPPDFIQIIKYIKTLRYDEKPDYEYLKMTLNQIKEKISHFDTKSVKTIKVKKSKKYNKKRSKSSYNDSSKFIVKVRKHSSDIKSIDEIRLVSTESTVSEYSSASNQAFKRNHERDSTVKGVMPEFKDRNIILKIN